MIRINLLPHREQRRKERRQRFFALVGASIGLGLLIGLVVHLVIGAYIDSQEARNDVFKEEIAKLDKDIAEIKRLRDQIDALLARKKVIESLQSNRAETVRVFNEFARLMPEGVMLKSVKQSGLKIELKGAAQSNARVSTLMRNLDGSPYLQTPQLVEIKAGSWDGRRVGEFTLNISIERPQATAVSAGAGAQSGGVSK
ncbi:MAG: PilN domain-containing protein [Zoogloeaceae bacterium]|nr:PilN domain-containing protein [Zoogloeaceae bacterium]